MAPKWAGHYENLPLNHDLQNTWKNFFWKIFVEGEESGIKADTKEVSQRMKHMKVGGKKVFDKSQWLSQQQVKSYFSRLTSLLKSGKLRNNVDEAEEGDVEMLEEAVSRQQLQDYVRENVDL